MVLWSASWLDTLPQAILIGLLAGEGRLHLSFVLAAFLANFPQALASASLLMEFKASPIKVLLAWSSIWLISSTVAFLVGWVTPVGLEDGDAGASSGYILRAGSTRKGILCRAGPVRHTVKRNGGASGSQTSMRTWST